MKYILTLSDKNETIAWGHFFDSREEVLENEF